MEFMTWPEILELFIHQIGQFIICIITSYIFVYFLLKAFSPRIKISKLVSLQTRVNSRTGIVEDVWIFKFINLSRFNAYNVKFHLARRVPYISHGKVSHKIEEITLNRQEVNSVPRFSKKEGHGDFAVLIGTTFDISTDMGQQNIEYEFSVSLCHGLSNLTKVEKQIFKSTAVIKPHAFEFGKSLEIQ